MKYVMMLMALLTNNEMYAQNLNTVWARSFSGLNQEVGKCITTDRHSNIYTAGYFTGTIDLDPGAGVYNVNTNGLQDVFISKLNSSGNLIWAKRIGGIGNDMIYSMALDTSGSIYISGYFHNSMDADPGPGTFYLNSTSSYSQDIFIIKLDTNASLLWAKSIGGNGYYDSLGNSYDAICSSYSIATDKQANVYFTGSYLGTIDFDPGIGVHWSSSLSVPNIFISKLDATGNLLWVKTMGENKQGDEAYSVVTDTNGNCYINGVFADTLDIDPGPSVYQISSLAYNAAFIVKLNYNGEFCWVQTLSGTNPNDRATAFSLSLDHLNNVYCTGIFKGECEYGNSLMSGNLISQGNYDVFLMKIDSYGTLQWAKSFGGSNADYCYSLHTDFNSGIFLGGSFKGSMDADPATPVYNLVSYSPNSSDLFISAFSSTGDLIGACSMGGSGNDLVNAIFVDSMNQVVVAGYYSNTVDFDSGLAVNNLTAIGGVDAFVLKLNYSGMVLPVELIEFNGIEVEAGNLLKWQTSSELNHAVFEIQKSMDAKVFSAIALIETMETASYLREYIFLDSHKCHTNCYYRLKSIDIDGQYSYSKTICIKPASDRFGLLAFPNPCHGELSLISKKELKNAVITVRNTQGEILLEKRNVAGNRFKCDLSSMDAGLYFVEIFESASFKDHIDVFQKIKIELIR